MKISISRIKSGVIFLLPTVVIISQWVNISFVRLSWIIALCLLVCIVFRISRLINNKLIFSFALIVCVYPFLSFLLGEADSFDDSLYISLVTSIVYMLYISFLNDMEYEYFLSGALFSCVLFAVWGCYEVVTGNYVLFNNVIQTVRLNALGSHYPGVAFANSNDLAQYLVMVFPIAVTKYVKKNRILFVMSIMAVFFVLLHSDSRLSMMVFICTFVMAYVVQIMRFGNIKQKIKLFAIGGIIGVLLCILNWKTGLITYVVEGLLVVDSKADYYTGRASLYVNLINTAIDHPLGGFGTSYAIQTMPPHNLFLFILCDYGWIPAYLFVALLIKFATAFMKQIRIVNNPGIHIQLFVSLCFFPIMSCVSSVNEQRKVIWLILGVFMRFYMQHTCKRKDSCENTVYY